MSGLGSCHLGQDVGRACGPDERLRVDVVMSDAQADSQFEFCHVGEAVPANTLVGNVAEAALDHVQPRYAGGG